MALSQVADGDSLREVARELNINRKSLGDRARAAAISIPRSGGQERYVIDHAAFSRIRRPDQAYVLGLLAADGNVHHPKDGRAPIISLRVQAQDEWLVSVTCRVMGTDEGRIRHWFTELHGRKHAVAGVAVSSKRIAHDLAEFGVVPRKSSGMDFPHKLTLPLQRHWLRGFFDGDGITAYVSSGEPRINLGFCGPYDLMNTIALLLYERCGLQLRPAISQNGISATNHRIQWRGREDVHRIAEYLYGDGGAALSLWRKRDLLLQSLGCPFHASPGGCALRTFVQTSFDFLEAA
ncbi:hypothetical protein [Gemmatimonas sp.]|uniref:hypothetical protein n=1 Tax=Gemmatimonas sp. TaxID=1962908 RepID=UPI003DA414F5